MKYIDGRNIATIRKVRWVVGFISFGFFGISSVILFSYGLRPVPVDLFWFLLVYAWALTGMGNAFIICFVILPRYISD